MATVVITSVALDDLVTLISSHSLPTSTRERVERYVRPLRRFPLLGHELHGRWARFRFILGPWRWMIIVYVYDEEADRVAIVTIQDGRSARSPTSGA